MTANCNCGAEWTGKRIEHCTACHETFSGTGAGDKHRTGDHALSAGPNRRRCLTVAEMSDRGMVRNERGVWTLGGVNPWAGASRDGLAGSSTGEGRGARVPGAESEGER